MLWFVVHAFKYLKKVDYAELPLATPLPNKNDFSKTYRGVDNKPEYLPIRYMSILKETASFPSNST